MVAEEKARKRTGKRAAATPTPGSLRPTARISRSSRCLRGPVAVRKEPTQARSRATVEAVLQASAELFAELGFAETTTNKIAKRAGVSVGSLYQYFPDKEAILTTLFEQHVRAGLPRIDATLERLADPGRSLREGLDALVQEVVEAHELSPRLHQVLFDEVPRSAIMVRMQADADRHSHEVVTRLLGRLPGVRQDGLDLIAHVLVQTTEALAHWIVLRAPRTLSRRRCVAEVVELLYRYVTETSQQTPQ